MAGCSICTSPPARALIDGALLSGNRPIDAFRFHGEALGLSLSAVYRHARAHRPGGTNLAPVWLGDTTSGELIADLAAQRRSHIEERDAALSRGDSTSAAREGHEATSIALALLKTGFSDDTAAASLAYADRTTRAIQRAARNNPQHARDLADAARELHDDALAADADALAESAETYNRTTSGSNNV